MFGKNKALKKSIREAIENCNSWQGGAVVVKFTDGSYNAIPQPYLNDISFTRRAEIERGLVFINSSDDLPLGDMTYEELLSDNDAMKWMINQFISYDMPK